MTVRAPDGKPAPRFARVKGRLPPHLVRCPGCGQHLYPNARLCPHCGGDLVKLGQRQAAAIRRAQKALATLGRVLSKA